MANKKGKTFQPYGNKRSGSQIGIGGTKSSDKIGIGTARPSKRQTSTKVHNSKGKPTHTGRANSR